MNSTAIFSIQKIIKCTVVGITFFLINFARGHTVTEHFDHKTDRHFYRADGTCGRVIVAPIFKMMTVTTFVVHPGQRISISITFAFIWTAGSLIISCTYPKFGRTVFGKIVHQAAPWNPRAEAVFDYLMTVKCNRPKMIPDILQANRGFITFFLE